MLTYCITQLCQFHTEIVSTVSGNVMCNSKTGMTKNVQYKTLKNILSTLHQLALQHLVSAKVREQKMDYILIRCVKGGVQRTAE